MIKCDQIIQDYTITTENNNKATFQSSVAKQLQNNQQQNKQQSSIMNPSLKETKCSTYIETSDRSILNNSQIEGKSSMFSQQFREINSQQNQDLMDQDNINTIQDSINKQDEIDEEQEEEKEKSISDKKQNSSHSCSVEPQNFYTFKKNTFEESYLTQDDLDDDFRNSILNATKISRINRDNLRNDLIKSKKIQTDGMNHEQYNAFNDEEEARDMFPSKSKSLLISIQNTSSFKRSGSEFRLNQYANENILLTQLQNCEQATYSETSQKTKINQNNPWQIDEITQQQIRRSSSSQALVQIITKKSEHHNHHDDQENCLEQNQEYLSKHKVIQATNHSMSPQLSLNKGKDVTNKNNCDNNNNIRNSLNQQQQNLNINLQISGEKDQEIEQEYYDEDYCFPSNTPLRGNQSQHLNNEIRFHKSFFVNDQNSNCQIQSIINGRHRENTENMQFSTEIQQFSTEFFKSQRLTLSKNTEKQPNADQPKKGASPIRYSSRVSYTTYDKQSTNGAISISTFMETKQSTFLTDWIQKRSSNLLVGWQKRWLVLKNKKLQYFKTDESTHYQGCIDFSILSCRLQKVMNKKGQLIELRIQIEDSSKVFRFKSPKQQALSLETWSQAIQKQIDSCSKLLLRPRHITHQRNFWKNDRVSLSEFESLADTGDFILFKGRTFGEKVIRNLINCEYNHIGMVLRTNNEKNNLLILEATGEEGVGLLSWKTFLKRNWQDLYHKISLRKLQTERTDEMLFKMEQFIRYAIGKHYKVSLSKLFKKKTDPTQDLQEDPNRTFFCSELIATIYKVCGFLPLDVSSGHYWPSSFEGSRNLKLLKNASLSEEFILDFKI